MDEAENEARATDGEVAADPRPTQPLPALGPEYVTLRAWVLVPDDDAPPRAFARGQRFHAIDAPGADIDSLLALRQISEVSE